MTTSEKTKIRIVDHLGPEDTAMLQALYSRSAESVDIHLEKVKEVGSGKFMSQYYVGYGHKSIADCGSTTMFIEGVSLLAAKAIQDWPLYSGQETGTRYVDMSKQEIIDPIGTPESKMILDRWMEFYISRQDEVSNLIRHRHPKREEEKQETYDRAVKARTFDILRGFLPAGITTQLSWHSNLRQAGDHLNWMSRHPLTEIRDITSCLKQGLATKYPSSGFADSLAAVGGISSKNTEQRDARNAWEDEIAAEFTYSVDSKYLTSSAINYTPSWTRTGWSLSDISMKGRYSKMLKTRPKGAMLPAFMGDVARCTFDFLLDFGSFRDIQRHRNGTCRMPLLDTVWGFEPWYLEQLGDPDNGNVGGLRDQAVALINEQNEAIHKLGADVLTRQYYAALGFQVPCQVTYGLPALLYLLELRSGKTVHPTLRKRILEIVTIFQKSYPNIALHADKDPDDWDVRRGDQTITRK